MIGRFSTPFDPTLSRCCSIIFLPGSMALTVVPFGLLDEDDDVESEDDVEDADDELSLSEVELSDNSKSFERFGGFADSEPYSFSNAS